MNLLLRPRICPAFLASSGHETCDVLLGIRAPAVARWNGHLHVLATQIHELSGLTAADADQGFPGLKRLHKGGSDVLCFAGPPGLAEEMGEI
jgi:hypothetical protein